MRVSPVPESNLRPESFVECATNGDRSTFVELFRGTLLLLVHLGEQSAEIEAALEDADTATIRRADVRDQQATLDALGRRALIAREAARRRSPGAFDHRMLQRVLSHGPRFAVPLRRRVLSMRLSEKLSIGRSRNNDIVLRHGSVSKLHAWFDTDEDGTFYLCDAHSKNATRVNGVIVDPSALVAVRAGDEIRFGLVETTVCSAELLWDALADGR